MTRPRRTPLRFGLGLLALAIVLVFARPWTIRPLHESPAEVFDAETYVASIWPRVLQVATSEAVDVTNIGQARSDTATQSTPTRRALFVRGTGVVSNVDLGSRVGLAHLRIETMATPGLAIQIGPVIRRTALRDALDFIRFTDFPNQSDFAAVANALNDVVLLHVLGSIDLEALVGQTVSFTGAVAVGGAPTETLLEIVPVIFEVGGSPQ